MDRYSAQKARAAQAAVMEVESGMLVGLGTGTTAAAAVTALARAAQNGLSVTCCATSRATEDMAVKMGLTIVPFDDRAQVDIAIDGADEVDPALRAIKGAGGALLREKVVARAARRFLCIVDETKLVDRLGRRAVPLEVLPFAKGFVSAAVARLGGNPALRVKNGQPARTDQENVLIDCDFGIIGDAAALAIELQAIPGLLGHGLFLSEIDMLIVGRDQGVERYARDEVATSSWTGLR